MALLVNGGKRMASIVPYTGGWRAHIFVGGVRESAVFKNKFDAESWAHERETELKLSKRFADRAKRLANRKHSFLQATGEYSIAEIVGSAVPIPETSGIYFLIKGDTVVYVGQSKNVYSRIRRHLDTKVFDKINVIACEESELNRLESMYIRKFSPVLNVVGKVGVTESELAAG